MSAIPEAPKPNRTPWIIAGVLGCLVICLLLAFAGGGAYVLLGRSQPTSVVSNGVTIVPPALPTVPPVVVPTLPSITVVVPTIPPVAQPTQASPAQPTQSAAQPTQAAAQPTLAPVAETTQQPAASPTATKPAAPSGKIAFSKSDGTAPENQSVWIMNADGSNAKKIIDRASHPAFFPDGTRIVYYHWTDGLYTANVDGTNSKKIVGDTFTGGNYGSPDVSHDGRWIAFSNQPGGAGNIFIVAVLPDGSGHRTITVGEGPSWKSDDTEVVFHTCRGSQCGIYRANSAGGDAIPIITDDGGLASWSPDGKTIVYQKEIDGQKQLFLINVDGSGKKQLTQGAALHVDAEWSSDGSFIFYRSPEGGTWGIWRMNADGSSPVKLIDNMGPTNWPYERLAVTR